MARGSRGDRVRWEVHYAGHVQGVGFRFSVVSIARRYSVVGYVQNLPDGRVRLVAEGPHVEVRSLLRDVAAERGELIHDVAREERPPTDEFTSFGIRH
jgi:acylphosphatase